MSEHLSEHMFGAQPPPDPPPMGEGNWHARLGQSCNRKYLKPSATGKLWPFAISVARSRIVCSSSDQSPTWLLCSRSASILRSMVSLMSTQASGSFDPVRY